MSLENYKLISGEDVHGNVLQAMVPVGTNPDPCFLTDFGEDWDQTVPLKVVADVYASTLLSARLGIVSNEERQLPFQRRRSWRRIPEEQMREEEAVEALAAALRAERDDRRRFERTKFGKVQHLKLGLGQNYGSILDEEAEGKEWFFHVSDLDGGTFSDLEVGDAVTFEVGKSERGRQACKVLKDKAHNSGCK